MKGDPAVITRTLEGYVGNSKLHEHGLLHKRSLWQWKKPYSQRARFIGYVVLLIPILALVIHLVLNGFTPNPPSPMPIIVLFIATVIVIPPLFGIIMTIPLILEKRRYYTTTEYAYYWRQNKALRACAPDYLTTDEFALIIEDAQRADHTAYQHVCIHRMRDTIERRKTDGKLPTIPEERIFLEALHRAVNENAEHPIT